MRECRFMMTRRYACLMDQAIVSRRKPLGKGLGLEGIIGEILRQQISLLFLRESYCANHRKVATSLIGGKAEIAETEGFHNFAIESGFVLNTRIIFT